MGTARREQRFWGREFTAEEASLIQEVIATCTGIRRTEWAHPIGEGLDGKRAGGGLKATECRELLERLESQGILMLPAKKSLGAIRSQKSLAPAGEGQVPCELTGRMEAFAPIEVALVQNREQRQLFRDLHRRYHYRGYAMPYGSRPRREVVGCLQFSSPAWRMKPRDQWIGWDDGTRGRRLQQVVNHSRFLVPAKIRNLAGTLLRYTLKRLRTDGPRHSGVEPWLVETRVNRERFHGARGYRASNFIVLGETSGRGRLGRAHQRHGAEVKTVMVCPLVQEAARRLRDGYGG